MSTLYTTMFFLAGTGFGLYLAGWLYVERFYLWKVKRGNKFTCCKCLHTFGAGGVYCVDHLFMCIDCSIKHATRKAADQ